MEERMLESQERTEDNELHGSHTWLPGGWLIEVRAGGKKMDKMYKYYTDPISHRVFRTLKSVLSYLGTGEISKHAYSPRRNVIDMYSFDKCADLPQSMLKRLKAEGQTKHKSRRALVLNKELPNDQTSNHSEGGLTPKSGPKGIKFGNEKGTSTHVTGSETTRRQRGRPKKILKQTNESISDRDRRHNETKHNEVKEEVDIGVEEGMPNGKTKEHTEMSECTTVIQEVQNNISIAERNLSKRKGDKSDLVAGLGLRSQENGRLTEAGEKATCSSVHKFYKRRCSNQMLGSNKG
ncbi:hypothetical protein PAHAL_7G055700 [Panicum hallii]|nr:hypothetical protein PAHAL_7G055700 [Panicum hallii]